MSKTESRKKDHVELVIEKGAQYEKTTGFEKLEFVHNALPEVSLEKIDLSVKFLGYQLKYPLVITGMTGGYSDATAINKGLAEAAQRHGLAFGLGSQRAMIEKPELAKTYLVRDVAPDIPVISNIGAYQLKKYSFEQIESLVDSVEADALAVHLNPLQEVIQGEGDTDFTGIVDAISKTAEKLDVPVIAKETGAGISQNVALKLKSAGVKYIDLEGAGGTSWSKVEYLRSAATAGFENWGIPTLHSILECRGILPMIASGGIRSGIDAAKAIALGAELSGAAYPFIKAFTEGSIEEYVTTFTSQMRICAFLTGSADYAALRTARTAFI